MNIFLAQYNNLNIFMRHRNKCHWVGYMENLLLKKKSRCNNTILMAWMIHFIKWNNCFFLFIFVNITNKMVFNKWTNHAFFSSKLQNNMCFTNYIILVAIRHIYHAWSWFNFYLWCYSKYLVLFSVIKKSK